ncbi:putative glutamyl-tRNA synthetase [Rosellinia necatrix]|uniref:Glutamate--tRNA ligase, mitochondrial n=1 Tax=Rosellinia necatrix TaxID=77044 RepID=A0A1W2TEP4_ROSNE|nr:putative glutamyl-tRNA synthetase [Rosellinia necatrix]
MSSLYVIRGVLSRQVVPRPSRIFSRSNFFGRPARSGPASLLPSTPARTRFAPSPTGYVHLGSLRTALFNYLLAKATGGQFVVRVEDTDQKRLVSDAEEKLYDDLKWAGLSWDEGPDIGGPYGPYKQSSRLQLYQEHASQLLKDGQAYRCFCTPEELDTMKKLALDESRDPVYNKKCSHISAQESALRAANGEEHCVRFKSDAVAPLVQDIVYGTYKSPIPPDDFIIIKRDGFPTYHFANVVDDHLMEITHVIRGAEWLISTPRHVALYNAFGWQVPQFAHVGLLVDQKKQKLSKRFGSFNLSSWKEKGILPIALLNYVLLLGWSPGRDSGGKSEIMDMKDMIQKFHLRFTKGDVTVNSKNEFFQKAHMRKSLGESGSDKESVIASLLPNLSTSVTQFEKARASNDGTAPHEDLGVRIGPLVRSAHSAESLSEASSATPLAVSQSHLKALLNLDGKSYTSPIEYLKRNIYLLWEIPEQEHRERLQDQQALLDKIVVREGTGEETQQHAQKVSELAVTLYESLRGIPEADWNEPNIKNIIGPFIKSIGYISDEKLVQAWGWKFLRWVVSASTAGPALIPSMVFLGKEEILVRVGQASRVAQSMEA